MNYLKIILLLISLVAVAGCRDVSDVEPNYQRELIFKQMSPSDTLNLLEIRGYDFGRVKLRSVNSAWIGISNKSGKDEITIYSIRTTNTSGLFEYTYSLPIVIKPGEDTEITHKLKVKFIANDFGFDFHYDTLFINNNPNFYVPVQAKVRY
jgi:heme/copper-type cytochrome/quinol oxidase subunit 2